MRKQYENEWDSAEDDHIRTQTARSTQNNTRRIEDWHDKEFGIVWKMNDELRRTALTLCINWVVKSLKISSLMSIVDMSRQNFGCVMTIQACILLLHIMTQQSH